MPGLLQNHIAVITGAGSGIGRAIATLFASEGAHVFVTDLNGESADVAARALSGQGLKATAMTVDVSRGQDVTALFREVERAFGRADVVVNNAGLNVRSDFRHLSDADWVKIREVNLDGVVRIARDAFGLLKDPELATTIEFPVSRLRLVMLDGSATVPSTVIAPVEPALPNTSVEAVMLSSDA